MAGIATVTVAPAEPSVPLRVTCTVLVASNEAKSAPEVCVPSAVVENEKMWPVFDVSRHVKDVSDTRLHDECRGFVITAVKASVVVKVRTNVVIAFRAVKTNVNAVVHNRR